jgi:hypothetical protein
MVLKKSMPFPDETILVSLLMLAFCGCVLQPWKNNISLPESKCTVGQVGLPGALV